MFSCNSGHHGSGSHSRIYSRPHVHLLHGRSWYNRTRNTKRHYHQWNLLYQRNDGIRMLRHTTGSRNYQCQTYCCNNQPCSSMFTCNSRHHGSGSHSRIYSRPHVHLLHGRSWYNRTGHTERNNNERNILYQRNDRIRMLRHTTGHCNDQRQTNCGNNQPCCGMLSCNSRYHSSCGDSGQHSRINIHLLHGRSWYNRTGHTERNNNERNLLYQGNDSIRMFRHTTCDGNDQCETNCCNNQPCCGMLTCNSRHHSSCGDSRQQQPD